MASEASAWASSSRTGGKHALRRDAVTAGRGARPAVAAPDSAWPDGATGAPGGTGDPSDPGPLASRPGRTRRTYLPLAIIGAVQTALSLPLAWTNTAFSDEANYLWIGRLIIAHWLHGKSWPAGHVHRVLSGSPVIYPPLGAVADGVAGLAGARILSLAFMLGATILLYLTASSLFGRTEAIIATALWAGTEAVYRLTFATYDPMSVFLLALSAWLAVEAGWRRRRGPLVASAAALALANATAYSSLVIDPVVIAFAFLVWLPGIGARRAGYRTAWFAAAWLALFCLLITVSESWAGIAATVLNRKIDDYQLPSLILGEIAWYSGFIIVTALTGAVIAIRTGESRRGLLALVGASALVVPAAQLYFQTGWALDKHLAFDIWFASMAAGYGCLMAGRRLATAVRVRPGVVAGAGVIALFCVLGTDWKLASVKFHQWPNATSFVTALRPVAARTNSPIFTSSQEHAAEYYTREGSKWWLWRASALSLDPAGVPRSHWQSYYATHVSAGKYGLIALFYATPRSGSGLSAATPPGSPGEPVYTELLRLKNLRPNEPGVPALTRVLSRDRSYRLVAVGPYDNSHSKNGIYAIWQRTPAA